MFNPPLSHLSLACLIALLCLVGVLPQGCVTATYVPPSYEGYKPQSLLPLKASFYFKPYEGTTPLALAKHDFHFSGSDFIQILFGITTVRATASALPQVFAKSVEIRDPTVSNQIKAAKMQDLFGEYIEAHAHHLVDRLELARKQDLDVLLDVEVAEYHHQQNGVRMTLIWDVYEVASSTRILDSSTQASAPNNVSVVPFRLRQSMMDSQEICRRIAHECVENMIRSISTTLLHSPDSRIGKERKP